MNGNVRITDDSAEYGGDNAAPADPCADCRQQDVQTDERRKRHRRTPGETTGDGLAGTGQPADADHQIAGRATPAHFRPNGGKGFAMDGERVAAHEHGI